MLIKLTILDYIYLFAVFLIVIGSFLADIRIILSGLLSFVCSMFVVFVGLLSGVPIKISISLSYAYFLFTWPTIYIILKKIQSEPIFELEELSRNLKNKKKNFGGISISNILKMPKDELEKRRIDLSNQNTENTEMLETPIEDEVEIREVAPVSNIHTNTNIETNNTLTEFDEFDEKEELSNKSDLVLAETIDQTNKKYYNPNYKNYEKNEDEWYWVKKEDLEFLLLAVLNSRNKMVSVRNLREFGKLYNKNLERYAEDLRKFLQDKKWADDWNNGVKLNDDGKHELTNILFKKFPIKNDNTPPPFNQ